MATLLAATAAGQLRTYGPPSEGLPCSPGTLGHYLTELGNSVGAAVYDIAIGADVAASAGVGAGVVGAEASAGGGVQIVWRFATPHEVARALRSMAVLQALGKRIEAACIAVDLQIERIQRAVDAARRAADRARAVVRSRMPWADHAWVRALQKRQDALRAERRALADRARRAVAQLIGWVADARIFLIRHQHGYEVRQTMAAGGKVGVDFVDTGSVSGSNLGASAEVGLERQQILRAEFVPECQAMAFERAIVLTRTITGSIGFVAGATSTRKRVVELTTKLQMGADGLQREASGTTVKITLDSTAALVLGAFRTAQAGIGHETTVQLRLADLLDYSKDAMGILLGGDDHAIAKLLLALPIQLTVRGRYEAGYSTGFGLDIEGAFEGGLSAAIKMTDAGAAFQYTGGSGASVDAGDTFVRMVGRVATGALQRLALAERLGTVLDEVASVVRRQ